MTDPIAEDAQPGDEGVFPSPSEPYKVVDRLLPEFTHIDGVLTLRAWRGGWMEWSGTHWADVEEGKLRALLYQRLGDASYRQVITRRGVEDAIRKPWAPTKHKISDVIDALKAATHLDETVDPPDWLVNSDRPAAAEMVACRNGILHVSTRKSYDLEPGFFNRVSVPFDYDPAAPEPVRWLRFLDQLWPDDPESITALQQMFGYVLSGRTDLQKILLMVGPSRSGKGTIARVLQAMIGRGHSAAPTLASLGGEFGLAPLLGKPLAVVSDARLNGAGSSAVVERLLSVSGEDTLTVNRKYREQWTGKLPTRFVILSNELPRFGDASGAITNRFIVLQMFQSFLGRENTRLTNQLLTELPGILRWSLDGLDDLTQQGYFTTPKASDDAISALQDLVSPTSAFVRDCCDVGPYEADVKELHAAWRRWCVDNSLPVTSTQTFGRDLHAVVPQLRVRQPRTDGGRARHWTGIRLKVDPQSEDRVPPRATPPERDGTRTLHCGANSCEDCGGPLNHRSKQARCQWHHERHLGARP